MPEEATPIGSLTATVEKGVVERMRSMGFAEFVLTAILVAIGFGFVWGVSEIKEFGTNMETAHREERNAADKSHRTERTEADERHAKTIADLIATQEKTLDRIERKVNERHNAGHAAALPAEAGPPGT